MSLALMAWAWRQYDVPPTPRYVLVTICDNASCEESCLHPSLAYLAKKTGYDRRTIVRAIDWLEEHRKLIRRGQHPDFDTTIYEIQADVFEAKPIRPSWKGRGAAPL